MSARVLVVDDTLPNVKLLEAKLTKEYYDVVTAFNGEEAIKKAKELSPDIILLDVMMPNIDGFETCKRLRSDPETSHIPVVMVTALSEKEDRVRGLEVGADDFLTKPVNDIALFARVKSLVRLKVMIDELRVRGQTGVKLGIENIEATLGNLSTAHIMVIDDDKVQVRQLTDKLSILNKNITVESNPEKALESAVGGNFDLIIVSTQMINADGLRICSQIRSNERTRNVSLITMIDENDTNALVKGLEIGVNDYIITPLDMNEMIARVKTQVRRKRYQDALRSNYKTSLSMAVTDALTGLYNRRYLDTHIETTIKEAVEFKKPLSLMMIDIDKFKSVNDTHGHLVGDEVIKQVAQRFMDAIRPSDLAARYGGEEFVLIMPGTLQDDACKAADRVRKLVEATPFTVSTPEGKLSVTISVGVTQYKQGEDSIESLLKRADEALYDAKRNGRNRVVLK